MRRLNKLEQSYSFLSARLPLVTRLGSLSARKNDDFRPTIMLRRRVNNWRDELTTENSLTVWSRRLSSRLSLSSRLGSLVSRLVSRSLSARAPSRHARSSFLRVDSHLMSALSLVTRLVLSSLSLRRGFCHDDGDLSWKNRRLASGHFQKCLTIFMTTVRLLSARARLSPSEVGDLPLFKIVLKISWHFAGTGFL